MPLPEGFSEWEHLQSTVLRIHNRFVRDEFSDIGADDEIAGARGSLRHASLIKDDDSAIMVMNRMLLFYVLCRKASDLQAPLYGTPISDFDERVIYRPQVHLYFRQDADSVPANKQPVRAQISFRLNESPQTITEADLRQIGTRIRSEFGTSGRYRWSRGKILVTYKDPPNGLNFQIYALNEAEGRQVIQKSLDVANRTYDPDLLVVHTPASGAYPTSPGNQTILGKSRSKPVRRSRAYVRFSHATAHIWGLQLPIILCGSPYRYPNVLVPLD
ncbi:MAG: hypothetical protein KME35_08070 [Aphanocapsa sp. GSE-SYN-MK-11-07L]|jgi:hypothetical protein|nr:hypothetical protein [Aphanocapsa sp. GSE-SYN-MK-11-07L]